MSDTEPASIAPPVDAPRGPEPAPTAAPPRPTPAALARRLGGEFLVPVLAIVTALVLSAGIIWVTTGDLNTVLGAYGGLFQGAFGSPQALANTLIQATPYIFA